MELIEVIDERNARTVGIFDTTAEGRAKSLILKGMFCPPAVERVRVVNTAYDKHYYNYHLNNIYELTSNGEKLYGVLIDYDGTIKEATEVSPYVFICNNYDEERYIEHRNTKTLYIVQSATSKEEVIKRAQYIRISLIEKGKWTYLSPIKDEAEYNKYLELKAKYEKEG
jgi:hypothetical protein